MSRVVLPASKICDRNLRTYQWVLKCSVNNWIIEHCDHYWQFELYTDSPFEAGINFHDEEHALKFKIRFG